MIDIKNLIHLFFITFSIHFFLTVYSIYNFLDLKLFQNKQGKKLNIKKKDFLKVSEGEQK